MFLKILTFIIMLVILLGFIGWHNDLGEIALIISAAIIAWLVANWLGVIPIASVFKPKSVLYFLWLLKEIIKSSLRIIKIVWSRQLIITPTFAWVKSSQINKIGLVIYCNSITLTPGTVTLDIQGNMLLLHALELASIVDLKEGEMDKKIKEIVC